MIINLVKHTIFLVNRTLIIRFTTTYIRSFSLFILILSSNSSFGQNQNNFKHSDSLSIESEIISYLDKAWSFINTDIDSMYYYDIKAFELAKFYQLEKYMADAHAQFAGYYEVKGDYDSAVYHHYQGISIYQNNDSLRRGLINAYYNLASTFDLFNFKKKAKKSINISLAIALEFNDVEHLAWTYFQISRTLNEDQQDSTIYFLKKTLKILDSLDLDGENRPDLIELQLAINFNLSQSYLNLNLLDSSKKYISLFEKLATSIDHDSLYNEMNSSKMNSLYYLAIEDFDKSIIAIRRLYHLSRQLKNPNNQLKSLEFLAEYHEKTDNLDSALYYFRISKSFSDTLTGGEVKSKIAEIETAFRTAEKEKKIIQLESQTKLSKSRNLLLSGLSLAFALIIIVVSIFYFINRKKSRILAKQNVIIQESYTEIENLIRESHHRIKNNLQVVSSLLKMQSKNVHSDEAKSSLMEAFNRVKTIALLHQRLQGSQSFKRIKVKDFIEQLTGNIKHSLTTEDTQIELNTHLLDIEIETDDTISIGLIINELITNSIKYAFPDKKGLIEVNLRREDKNLLLEVKDNGIGFPENFDPLSGKSLGFKIVKSLATKLKAELKVSNENGSLIQIKMKP